LGTTALPMPAREPARGPQRLLALRGDPHLVARVRAGDSAAFEVLYARHVPGILSFCRHMLGSREEAEDAVQAVFISAHSHLIRDDREINLKPWLYAIARNRCLSMLRARREEGRGEIELSTEGLGDVVQRRAELRALLGDLHDLPDDQRAALVLSELGDLSHAEVAGVLGCEPAQVKGLVFRARTGLAERREAREAGCEEIRVELANATGGGLRRGRLRHHVKACPGCSAYLEDLRRQRRMLSLVLPVAPSLGLKSSVLTALGGGGAAAAGAGSTGGAAGAATAATAGTVAGGVGAGAAATSGGIASLGAATAVKLAVAGALVAGAGAATLAADRDQPAQAPAADRQADGRPQAPPDGGQAAPAPAAPGGQGPQAGKLGEARDGSGGGVAGEAGPRGSARAPAARGRWENGARRARGRTGAPDNGRGATGRPAQPPGRTRTRGREQSAPQQARPPQAPATARGRSQPPPRQPSSRQPSPRKPAPREATPVGKQESRRSVDPGAVLPGNGNSPE